MLRECEPDQSHVADKSGLIPSSLKAQAPVLLLTSEAASEKNLSLCMWRVPTSCTDHVESPCVILTSTREHRTGADTG